MENKGKHLIVIAGPTGVGKTALSVKLAKAFQSEILSADSRQFFKELNIGTAKPTQEEMEGVKHHFINSHSIFDNYSVGQYENNAIELLENLFQVHPVLFLVGGSGLYVKSVTEGLDDVPAGREGEREILMHLLEKNGIEFLLQELRIKDPDYYLQVDKQNTQRIVRALEVIRTTQTPFSHFRQNHKKERSFNVIKIGIELPRETLYHQIDYRMDEMLKKGLIEEASQLYPHKNRNALQTVGYSEIFDFLDNKYDKDEMIRLLKRNSRRYAKRQLTWFKKDDEFTWFAPFQLEEIKKFIQTAILH